MGVDHRRLNAPMAQELLHRTDIVAGQKEVGGERVAEGVAGGRLDDPRFPHRSLEGTLNPPLRLGQEDCRRSGSRGRAAEDLR